MDITNKNHFKELAPPAFKTRLFLYHRMIGRKPRGAIYGLGQQFFPLDGL